MRAAVLVRSSLGLLLALQLGTAFAGVTLLARMAPAIERIIQANTRSLEAVETMLAALSAGDATGFSEALEKARSNVTEAGETPPVEAIDAAWRPALAGDPLALATVREQCLALARVNHDALREADDDARQLAKGGAVSMVLLGLAGLLAATAVARRSERTLVRPLEELSGGLRQIAAGDALRRCAVPRESAEIAILASEINRVLDARALTPEPGPDRANPARDAALEVLLGEGDLAAVVVASDGEIVAASAAARELLLGPDGARARLALGIRDAAWVVSSVDLPRGAGAVVVLRDASTNVPGGPAV